MESARPVLMVLTTGKEAFVRANALLQMTLMVRKTGKMPVELLALGPGVEIFRSNQKNSPAFGQLLDSLRQEGVALKVCAMSLENLGLTEDQMFPADQVKGGVEVAEKLAAGYTVLTF